MCDKLAVQRRQGGTALNPASVKASSVELAGQGPLRRSNVNKSCFLPAAVYEHTQVWQIWWPHYELSHSKAHALKIKVVNQAPAVAEAGELPGVNFLLPGSFSSAKAVLTTPCTWCWPTFLAEHRLLVLTSLTQVPSQDHSLETSMLWGYARPGKPQKQVYQWVRKGTPNPACESNAMAVSNSLSTSAFFFR